MCLLSGEFRRDLEEPIAASVAVSRRTPIVITEGNYLLLDTPPWSQVRTLLDLAWYLDLDHKTRINRLVARHRRYGKSVDAARTWAEGSDQRNAELVRASRHRADRIMCATTGPVAETRAEFDA